MSTITLQNLTFSYSDPYVSVFKDISLQLDTNWRTALIGRNGRGHRTPKCVSCPDDCAPPTGQTNC